MVGYRYESNRLYQEVMKDYEGEAQYRKFLKVKNNEYFNALQVKFSYAITCHKSQGGQWNTVFRIVSESAIFLTTTTEAIGRRTTTHLSGERNINSARPPKKATVTVCSCTPDRT